MSSDRHPALQTDAAPLDREVGFHKQNWPFYWITQTSNRYMQVMETRFKEIGIDVSYWRVLMSLYEDQRLSIAEISNFCIIKHNTATKIIQRMIAQGLVQTGPREGDGRVTEVRLTEQGDVLRRRARAVADEVFNEAFSDLSPEEEMILNVLLKKVFQKL